MSEFDTTLSGAAYSLRRVCLLIWRWRTLPPYEGATGLAWGRRGAMRAARTNLRNRKPSLANAVATPADVASLALPVQPKAITGPRGALKPVVSRRNGERDTPFAPRPDRSPHLNRH